MLIATPRRTPVGCDQSDQEEHRFCAIICKRFGGLQGRKVFNNRAWNRADRCDLVAIGSCGGDFICTMHSTHGPASAAIHEVRWLSGDATEPAKVAASKPMISEHPATGESTQFGARLVGFGRFHRSSRG